jgi:hypothetical protein
MDAAFRVIRNGRETLHTEDELRQRAAAGLVAAGDLVYHPILGRWLYAREVEELRDALSSAANLGRPVPPSVPVPSNGEAIAGFILGVLGHLPLVGFLCCVLGIYFSSRGLKRAAEMSNRGHGLAVAGMVLSIVFLVPATACGAIFLSGVLGH